jgi:hypothetical protein
MFSIVEKQTNRINTIRFTTAGDKTFGAHDVAKLQWYGTEYYC